MRAVHEPDARESKACGATEARGALPGRNALEDHDTRQRTVAHAQVCRVLARTLPPGKSPPRQRPP
jgi:hypothetical protein